MGSLDRVNTPYRSRIYIRSHISSSENQSQLFATLSSYLVPVSVYCSSPALVGLGIFGTASALLLGIAPHSLFIFRTPERLSLNGGGL